MSSRKLALTEEERSLIVKLRAEEALRRDGWNKAIAAVLVFIKDHEVEHRGFDLEDEIKELIK